MSIHPLPGSVRPSPIFVALVAVTALGGVLSWQAGGAVLGQVGVFVFVIAGWLVSLCLHEFGHAYTAWRFGDHDAAVRGYLTLNPLRYSHPLLSLGLPLFIVALGGIGLPGGAVYVRTGPMSARQRTIVSLAGPSANLLLAVLLLAATGLLAGDTHLTFWAAMAFLGFLQVTALVLNLLPVPGLDGYGALEPHLSPQTRRSLEPAKSWGLLVLVALLFAPAVNKVFFTLVLWFFDLSGVNRGLVGAGFALIQFWRRWM